MKPLRALLVAAAAAAIAVRLHRSVQERLDDLTGLVMAEIEAEVDPWERPRPTVGERETDLGTIRVLRGGRTDTDAAPQVVRRPRDRHLVPVPDPT